MAATYCGSFSNFKKAIEEYIKLFQKSFFLAGTTYRGNV